MTTQERINEIVQGYANDINKDLLRTMLEALVLSAKIDQLKEDK